MGKSLLQTVNQAPQTVAVEGIISPGSVLRRYGCNCRLSGNAQELSGEGYYKLTGSVTVEPTAAGLVTVALYHNGVQLPGAIASATAAAAGDAVALPLVGTIRLGCCCGENSSTVTAVLVAGAGVVTNYSLRIEKD